MHRLKRLLGATVTAGVVICGNISIANGGMPRVRDAWLKRENAIVSFLINGQLQKTEMVNRESGVDDPYGALGTQDRTALTPLTLKLDAVYGMEGGKVSYEETGASWDFQQAQIRVRRYKVVDAPGHHEWVLEEGPISFGRIGLAPWANPDEQKTSVPFTPVWLLWSPVTWLQARGYLFDQAIVNNFDADHSDGTKCWEITVPRIGGRWVGTLYVDPERDFVPLRFVQKLSGGGTMSECSINYRTDDEIGWAISSATDSYFDENGDPTVSYHLNVTHSSFNEGVDQSRFVIEFPVGTQVVQYERGSKKYLVQEDSGERREISEGEFGKLPAPDSPGAASP